MQVWDTDDTWAADNLGGLDFVNIGHEFEYASVYVFSENEASFRRGQFTET